MQFSILHAINEGTRDPAAIPLLEPLVRSDRLEARFAAAYALKNIGTQACEPLLRSLLSDREQRVRYVAAIGLADIAKEPQMHPSVDEFRRNESKYTSHWKSNSQE
jgi:HEAT repeat protein